MTIEFLQGFGKHTKLTGDFDNLDIFVGRGYSYVPMSAVLPMGTKTPSKSWLMPTLMPASIQGDDGIR